MKDEIFTDKEFENSDFLKDDSAAFAFNSKVAAVFDDMVSRSVPGYLDVQELSAKIALKVVTDGSTVYDIGCSTGTSLIKIAQTLDQKDQRSLRKVKLIGIDSSVDMLQRCKEKLRAYDLTNTIELIESSISDVILDNASLIISHYTLQFINPELRIRIVKNIKNALNTNGHFILSEKIRHEITYLDEITTERYYQFKSSNGYSEIENIRKRKALENVLIPYSLDENLNMLKEAGFGKIEILHKEHCFVSMIAQI